MGRSAEEKIPHCKAIDLFDACALQHRLGDGSIMSFINSI